GWLVNDTDQDRVARFEDAQLFQLLQLLQSTGGHVRQLQEKLPAIGVEADVLIKVGWILLQERVFPLPRAGNRASAEIEGAALRVEHNLDAGWVEQLFAATNGRGQRCHDGRRMSFQ